MASLYDVRKKYPKQWPTEPASIDLSVNRWLKDVGISLQYVDDPAHFIVRYESLVANPEAILKPLCRFIGVDYLPDMLSRYAATAQLVSLSREPWKAGVAAPIRNANATKFYRLFGQAEQASILERTSAIALEALPTSNLGALLSEESKASWVRLSSIALCLKSNKIGLGFIWQQATEYTV